MAKKPTWLIDEVADFLASSPSREALLTYRPTHEAQDRCNWLVNKSKTKSLTPDEEWELDQFEHLEILIQSIKARLRSRRPVPS